MASNLLKKLGGIIGAVAPTIATALGTPLAGGAIKMVLSALGVETEQQAMTAIQNDPEALVKLKTAEMDYAKRMKELDIDVYKIDAADRSSARTMADKTGIWPQVLLTVLFTGGYFWLMSLFFTSDLFEGLDDWAKGQVGILIGVMTTVVIQQMNFWFGSSKGSKDKTEKLGKAI